MRTKANLICLTMIFLIGLFFVPHSNAAPEKKLIIGAAQEPTSMDQSLAFSGADFNITDNWGEWLIDKAPNGELKPGIAASWTISPDGKRIEFTLRKGVKFHSGDPLTTNDVRFSFERGIAKNSTTRTRLRSMERIEVIDDYHFKVHFKAPDVPFIGNRGITMVSKSYYDRVGEDRFTREPVGTGPYKFVKYVPGEYVDVERFEDYWGDKPPIKEARFLFVLEDTTRMAKLKAGEVDLINSCPYPSLRDLESDPALKVIKLANNHPTPSIIFANRNPKTPWHDKRVRLAMACAIDWRSIIKNVCYDIPNHWAYLAPHEPGYDPNLKPYPYDPRKSSQLLTEAGYPKGFDLKLYWQTTGTFPMAREVVEAIASYLGAVGIRTKLIGEEYAAAVARLRASRGPDAATIEYVCFRSSGRPGGSDPSYYMSLYLGSEGGFSAHSNPELDKLIAQALATMDDIKRGEIIKKATWLVHEEVATIPIYNMVSLYGMKKNIDFKPTQRHITDLLLIRDITIR
jgi:peptide/nickel transport system substrate-binding protein